MSSILNFLTRFSHRREYSPSYERGVNKSLPIQCPFIDSCERYSSVSATSLTHDKCIKPSRDKLPLRCIVKGYVKREDRLLQGTSDDSLYSWFLQAQKSHNTRHSTNFLCPNQKRTGWARICIHDYLVYTIV